MNSDVELLRLERERAEREVALLRRQLEQLRTSPNREDRTPTKATVRKWQELKNQVSEFGGNKLDFDR